MDTKIACGLDVLVPIDPDKKHVPSGRVCQIVHGSELIVLGFLLCTWSRRQTVCIVYLVSLSFKGQYQCCMGGHAPLLAPLRHWRELRKVAHVAVALKKKNNNAVAVARKNWR